MSEAYRDGLRREVHDYNLMMVGLKPTLDDARGCLLLNFVVTAALVFWCHPWVTLSVVAAANLFMGIGIRYRLNRYEQGKENALAALSESERYYL